MVTHRYTPVIPPARPIEPEAVLERLHADLATLATPALVHEEFAFYQRFLAGGRPTPGDLVRLAACQARAAREEGGR